MFLTAFMERSKTMQILFRKKNKTRSLTRYLMGCFIEVEVTSKSSEVSNYALEKAFNEMKRVEHLLSKFISDSEVSGLNRSAGKSPVKVSRETFNLVKKAIHYSRLTHGSFDITVSPFIELWNVVSKEGRIPTQAEIKDLSSKVGCHQIVLDEASSSIFFRCPQMKVDLGSMGKGYAIDCAVEVLKSLGIKKALINAGSTAFSLGDQTSRVGVANPRQTDEVLETLSVQNGAVATSAAYEQYWEIANRQYGHILNPRTGFPIRADFLSVSVVTSTALLSDLMSTVLFSLGRKEAQTLARKIDEVESTYFVSA